MMYMIVIYDKKYTIVNKAELVSQPGRHIVMKKCSDVIYLLQQTNFRNVFSNYPKTIPGWLTMFYLLLFGRITQFKMAATCTNYYVKNGIFSSITMQIVNAIYGFVCLEGQGS